jgi:anti-anti-sigma regulatory factor
VLVVPWPSTGGALIDLSALRRLDNRAVATITSTMRAWRLDGRPSRVTGASPTVVADAERLGVLALLALERAPSDVVDTRSDAQ